MISSKGSAKAIKKPDTQQRGAEAEPAAGAPKATGRWTREEHYRFLEALKLFGKEWKKV